MADGVHKYPIDPTLTTGAAGTADGNAGVNLTEGVTQVNAINNAMRGLIGDIGSWRDDVSGANTTTGSANTYVLATTSGLTSLQDGLTLTFLINVTNTGASTLNVDTLGAKKLLASGASLVAGNLVAGQPVTVVYDASADSAAGAWLVANPVPVAASVSYDSDDISNVSTVSGANVSTRWKPTRRQFFSRPRLPIRPLPASLLHQLPQQIPTRRRSQQPLMCRLS